MAELIFTTESFQPNGTGLPGVPILLDNRMRLVEPACAWLLHIALVRGRTRSRETWRTYGEALYDWWQTIEANGWRWDNITIFQMAAYRDGMLQNCSVLGKPFARSTINSRLRTVARFYRWCVDQRIIDNIPFPMSEISSSRSRPPSALVHIDATGGKQFVNELTVRHSLTLPRQLKRSELRRIIATMSVRDRLVVEWALTTGMRRMEVPALRLTQLPCVTEDSMVPVKIDTTKGGKARVVYPPQALIDRTWAYVREERSVVTGRAKRHDSNYQDPETLFLTRDGNAMTPERVGALFVKAANRVDVKTSFHYLRHSFAAAMLRFLQRQTEHSPDLNPLLTLQVMLGHSDLSTTAIYLRVLATDLSAVESSVDDLYAALI